MQGREWAGWPTPAAPDPGLMSPEGISADGVMSCRVTICNSKGLHARAAAKFVNLAGAFGAEVMVVKKDTAVPGSSILGLMMLAAGPGSELELRASGPDAKEALAALERLVLHKFDEE